MIDNSDSSADKRVDETMQDQDIDPDEVREQDKEDLSRKMEE